MWLSGRMCVWHVQDPKINLSTTHEKEKKNEVVRAGLGWRSREQQSGMRSRL